MNWIYEPSPVKNREIHQNRHGKGHGSFTGTSSFDRQIAENARQGLFERIDRVQEKIANGKALDENEQTLLEEVFEKHEQGRRRPATPSTIKRWTNSSADKGYRVLRERRSI